MKNIVQWVFDSLLMIQFESKIGECFKNQKDCKGFENFTKESMLVKSFEQIVERLCQYLFDVKTLK